MKQSEITSDTIILGGGLIGLIQALSLALHGIKTIVVDKNNSELMTDDAFDGRTSAIISSSMEMLNLLDLNPNILGTGEAITKIIVRDGVNGEPIDFDSDNDSDDRLAMVFENRKLRKALLHAAQSNTHISLHMPATVSTIEITNSAAIVTLDDGQKLSAPLLIGADGSNSKVRSNSNISLSHWNYDHHALVAAIQHSKPHDNIAHEIFFTDGPLALLPMPANNNSVDNNSVDNNGDYRSSLIWSVPSHQISAYQKLSSHIFCHELNKKTNMLLGHCSLLTPIETYPLGFHSSTSFITKRTALIGDSAHRVHPIAGQGLNLGFRDVAALTEVLVSGMRIGLDCGNQQILEQYDKWRNIDNLSVSFATDSIHRIYALEGKTASNARRLGMSFIQNTPSVKAFFMAEARGETGNLPKMLLGQMV